MSDFNKAQKDKNNAVIYQRDDGSGMRREGGTLSWRNNNPGNIVHGEYATKQGAIGQNGRFAVFPNVDQGYQAMENLFSTKSYKNLTLEQAINRYAPSTENDTSRYISFIEKSANLERSQTINNLSADEKRRLTRSMSRFEGFKAGDEFHFKTLYNHDNQ